MIEEVAYCKKIMKKEFNKKLVMSMKDEKDFRKTDKCEICGKNMLMVMLE